jgi:tetratricopeptide (TPR) repeat protein
MLLPAYLVATNLSLGYWAPAGLETAAFGFCALLSFYFYLTKTRLLILPLTLAVWIRPEGALVTGLLIVIEAIVERKVPRFTLICAGLAFVLSLPMVVFKLIYYGSILPNPVYAKTGISIDQVKNGIEYAGRFFKHYGFFGIGFVLPLLWIKRLSPEARAVWLLAVTYTIYIVVIGGDVLKVHRFFIPVFGPAALLVALSLRICTKRLQMKTRNLLVILAAIPLLLLTYLLPHEFVMRYNKYEKRFTAKMSKLARDMRESDERTFSVALTTIGIFSYELIGHEAIDMLGLTDSAISRHPEEPIPGIETTWKERRYNSRYLLEREPDYIIFSTGVKPSAPAEKALLLYAPFIESYRMIPWFYREHKSGGTGTVNIAFKKVRPLTGDLVPSYPISYVDNYKLGIEQANAGNYREALRSLDQAIKDSPRPYNVDLLYWKGFVHMQLKQHELAVRVFNAALKQDSMNFAIHRELYMYERLLYNTGKAEVHKRWLLEIAPWYFPRVDSFVTEAVKIQEKTGRRPDY